MRALKLNSITFAIILFILAFIADAKTLKVDTLTPSVTDGNLLLQRNGTGEVTFGDYSGFCKFASGSPTCYVNIDLTSHVTGILPIANGGTGTSSTTFVNAATNVTGVLPVANGGTGSASQNFVDLTANQSIAGLKTFTNLITASSAITFDEIATPSTPSSGIKVYAKSDGKLYQLDSAGSEKKVGSGGGGEAGINFIADGSFEDSTLNPDSDGGGTESYQTYTADADLYSESNLQYFRVAYTGLSAADTYVRDSFARTSLDNKQGFFSIWIKASADDFKVCVRVDDATFAAACDSALEHTIIGDSTWRKYEIPFVFGSATVQYEIYNESYTGDVNIEIDKVYVGTVPDGYIQTVGQASFVGSLTQEVTNCQWTLTDSSYAAYAADSDCSPSNITGNIQAPDTKIPAVKIPNARTDGYYQIKYQGFLFATASDTVCYYTFSSSSSYESQGEVRVDAVNTGRIQNTVEGNFKFSTSGDKTLQIIAYRSAGTGACNVYGESSNRAKFTVHFFPDSEANIVTQSTELDATTANTLSARIATNAAVTTEDYDFINGNCSASGTGEITCTFNSGVFATAPACNVTTVRNFDNLRYTISANIKSVSSSSIVFASSITDDQQTWGSAAVGADSSTAYTLTCNKQGTDVNKSATIIGKFENINSSDLTTVHGVSNGNTSITANTTNIDFTEVTDNKSTWNGTQFTADSDGVYIFDGMVNFSASISTIINAYVDTGGGAALDERVSPQTTSGIHKFHLTKYLSAGDIVSFRSNTNGTLSASTSNHWLRINKLPDTESIIKNLNDNNNFECQTTFLTSAVTSDTNPISDLTRSNLTVGKKYKIILKPVTLWQNTTTGWYEFNAINNSEVVCRSQNSGVKVTNDNVGSTQSTCYFTAAATSLTFQTSGMAANMTLSDGSDNRTFISLCELPDNTIINSVKFD